MRDRREIVAENLAACVARLDSVLRPWGFAFEADECRASHSGPFASGHYRRDPTRIGISCRDTIDNIYYEHAFVTQHPSWREIERFTIGHPGLMHGIDHSEDCHLIGTTDLPDTIAARDGGDRVAALIHDWREFAVSVLAHPCSEFFDIVRRGARSYSIE